MGWGSEKGFKSLGEGAGWGFKSQDGWGRVDCPVGLRGRIQNLKAQALDGLDIQGVERDYA